MRLSEIRPALAMACAALLALPMLNGCSDGSQPAASKPTQKVGARNTAIDPALLTVQINSAPLFETQGGWSAGYALARGKGRGVVVGPGGGNPNVFAQPFAARPDEAFKVIARASSVGQARATGRIQINWTAPGGKFISVSSKVFDVVAEEGVFEHVVRAPDGASAGTLYVVADGPDSVVRYTEMRLLGEPSRAAPAPAKGIPGATAAAAPSAFPRPPNLTPLDGSGKPLTVAESQYYFYHAARAMQRKAREHGSDFIMYVMPDHNISRLMPAIRQLRAEGIKVLAYEPQGQWTSGVDPDWYWQKADSHWTEAAVRLTADEILAMWKSQAVANRPYSRELGEAYADGAPAVLPVLSGERTAALAR
jgi:hypothetical protein